MFKPHTLVAAILLAGMAATAHAGLITNGSFEAQMLSNGSWSNKASLTGWQAGTDGVEVRNNVAGAAQAGLMYVELDTTRNSSIWQTLTTDNGQRYQLSAWYSPRPGVAQDSNDIQVWWNSSLVATLSGSGAGQSAHQWRQYNWGVTGTGQDTLRFTAAGRSDALGGSLDSVTLQGVPEPGGLALVLTALSACFGLKRRTRSV